MKFNNINRYDKCRNKVLRKNAVHSAAVKRVSFTLVLCCVLMFFASGVSLANDGGSSTIQEEVKKANTIKTTTPLNTNINLFDYWVHDTATENDWIKQYESSVINSNTIEPRNYHQCGINAGHPLIFGNTMGQDSNYGLWNTTSSDWPKYMKPQNSYEIGIENRAYIEGIVDCRLGKDGMPHLKNKDSDGNYIDFVGKRYLAQKVYESWNDAGKDTSLAYLFDPDKKNVSGRAVYKNVRDLFTLDGNSYKFNSSTNFAEFKEDKSADSDGYFVNGK